MILIFWITLLFNFLSFIFFFFLLLFYLFILSYFISNSHLSENIVTILFYEIIFTAIMIISFTWIWDINNLIIENVLQIWCALGADSTVDKAFVRIDFAFKKYLSILNHFYHSIIKYSYRNYIFLSISFWSENVRTDRHCDIIACHFVIVFVRN